MTLEQCYEKIGDIKALKDNIPSDALIEKLLNIFLEDQSFENLKKSLGEGNVHDAFIAAHTLKGAAANMCLNSLYDSACAVTEALRHATDTKSAAELMPELENTYTLAADQIQKFLSENS